MKKMTKLGFSFVMACGMLITPIMASAQTTDTQKIDYVALGDSLAAGQTPDKQIDKGYTDFIGAQMDKVGVLGSFDKRFAVSGYTTSNVLEDIQNNVKKQDTSGNMLDIQSAIKNAEVITLDAGANDLLHQIVINQTTGEITYDQAKLADALKMVGTNTANILTQVKKLNINADIYVMGYYNPFPYLASAQQAQLQPLLDALNTTINQVATSFHVTFVPTDDSFAANAKSYLPNPQDIHPNQAGYLVLANDFWKFMNVKSEVSFHDILPADAKDVITYLAKKGIVTGNENGDFLANDPITRVQSAIMLSRAIIYNGDAAPDPLYADVSETSYGYDVIAKLTQEGVFAGDNHNFYPQSSLTRAQMAKILVNAFHLTGSSNKVFSDVGANDWAATYVNILATNHIVKGYEDGTFKPNEPITRKQFSVMLGRVLNDRFQVN